MVYIGVLRKLFSAVKYVPIDGVLQHASNFGVNGYQKQQLLNAFQKYYKIKAFI